MRRPPFPCLRAHALAFAFAFALAPLSAPLALLRAQQAQAPASRQVDIAALDRYFARAQKDWGVPGMAVAIVKDGKVVLVKGYGVRELGRPEPVDENTLFAIASNTKAFTAVSLGTLVDQGKLGWDTPVRQVLPWFTLYAPYVSEDARVRDLLSHRIGLRTYGGDLLWYDSKYTAEDVARRARFLLQAGPYRSSYHYNNVMFITAGLMIPALTGRTWTDYVASTILVPLGMTRTVTSVDSLPHRSDVATPHASWRGNLQAFPWRSWNNVQPAGGIISSAADMARWLRLLAGRGTVDGQTVIKEATLRALWTPQYSFTVGYDPKLPLQNIHLRGYGMGFGLMDYRGRFVASHGGAADGMFSQLAVVPEEGLGVVVLTNSQTSLPNALVNRVLDEYLSPSGATPRDWSADMLPDDRKGVQQEEQRRLDYIKPPASPRPPQALATYVGTYGGDLYGDATVALEGGKLVLRLLPSPELVADLTPLDGDRFLLEWRARFPWFDRGIARFLTDGQGKPTELKLDVPNNDFWFDELPLREEVEHHIVPFSDEGRFMNLRMLGMVAVMALVPVGAGVRGQVPPCCSPLSTTLVNRMIPLLQGEAIGSKGLDDRLAQRGMTKQEYTALKDALMVAKLDATDARRLAALPFDDGSRSVRQANVALYRTHKPRIDAALAGLKAQPLCGLCVPGVPATPAKTH